MSEITFSVSQAAKLLPEEEFSVQDLYYFLKFMNIVDDNRRPAQQYVDRGLLVESYGSKCSYSRESYPTTRFTKKGIKWLLDELYPQIKKLMVEDHL